MSDGQSGIFTAQVMGFPPCRHKLQVQVIVGAIGAWCSFLEHFLSSATVVSLHMLLLPWEMEV